MSKTSLDLAFQPVVRSTVLLQALLVSPCFPPTVGARHSAPAVSHLLVLPFQTPTAGHTKFTSGYLFMLIHYSSSMDKFASLDEADSPGRASNELPWLLVISQCSYLYPV